MSTITPCLWFDTEGEDAARFSSHDRVPRGKGRGDPRQVDRLAHGDAHIVHARDPAARHRASMPDRKKQEAAHRKETRPREEVGPGLGKVSGVVGYTIAGSGSARMTTVSTTRMISSTGSPARAPCLRIASGPVAS